jgi:hypothetical protein
MKHSKSSALLHLSKFSIVPSLAAILLSNTVLAESYQSFSAINYSHNKSSFNRTNVNDENKSDSISLSSQYFFDERQALGPLNEFDYINKASNVYAYLSNSDSEYSASYNDQNYSTDDNNQNVSIGGQWITHNVIVGASYSHHRYDVTTNDYSFDMSDNYYSASLGYFLLDDLVVRADYNDGGDGDDFFSYSARYNWQLAGTDYIGFSYNVDEDFDIHQLSSRYFVSLTDESYLVLGGNYTFDNRDNWLADDTWSINSSYYFNTKTSVSVYYGEDDYYGVNANYFINNNYAVNLGYNSVNNDKDEAESDGYHLGFTAQF